MFRSITNKIIFLIIVAVLISVFVVERASTSFIRNSLEKSSRENIELICDSAANSINVYFDSIEQSVESMAVIVKNDFASGDIDIHNHVKKIAGIFESVARNTRGALTFYYRFEDDLFEEDGFWYYADALGNYTRAILSDISAYDEDDVSHVGWFYIPKKSGKSLWISPYLNKNLNVHMMSYVVPVSIEEKFIGVLGMDISYAKLVEQLKKIDVMESGYLYLIDKDGKIIYHPKYEYGTSIEDLDYHVSSDENGYLYYEYNGELRRAISADLTNGMKIFVSIADNEITSTWKHQVLAIRTISLLTLVFFMLLAWILASRITSPLKKLTEIAKEVDKGNYDVMIDYKGKDEVGILANVFDELVKHLKGYIGDLNSKAYTDELTDVKNKTSFNVYAKKFDIALEDGEPDCEKFAVCMFDCNDLKRINDDYGHQYGDIYLKRACYFICKVFAHSPVFRIGGDEFAAILTGNDFEIADKLMVEIEIQSKIINGQTENEWEKINFASGIAFYDEKIDKCFSDVLARADENMYKQKKEMKHYQ